MIRRPVPAALAVALGPLAAAGCASVEPPAYPVAVERRAGAGATADGGPSHARLGVPTVPVALAAAPREDARAGTPRAAGAAAPIPVAAVARVPGTVPDAPGPVTGGGAAIGILESGRTVTIYASDDAFRAEYETDAGRFNLDNARLTGGFLLSEERDNVFTGTVMLDTFPGLVEDVRLSFGARGYVALLGVENRDVFGLGLGVQGAYELPIDVLPLQLGSEFFYTPDVLAFGQSDRIFDWNVDVGLAVRDNVSAFVGFRFLQFDTRPGEREVEDEVHVGVRWAFEDEAAPAEVATAPAPPRFR